MSDKFAPAANSAAETALGGNLTMAILLEAMAKLPPPPKWKACAIKPRHLAKLREQSRIAPTGHGALAALGGLPFYEKHGQIADCWMFAEEETLRQYLEGELSELDLIKMMATGTRVDGRL